MTDKYQSSFKSRFTIMEIKLSFCHKRFSTFNVNVFFILLLYIIFLFSFFKNNLFLKDFFSIQIRQKLTSQTFLQFLEIFTTKSLNNRFAIHSSNDQRLLKNFLDTNRVFQTANTHGSKNIEVNKCKISTNENLFKISFNKF